MRKLKEYRPNLRYLSVKQLKLIRSQDKQSMTSPPENIFLSIKYNRILSKFVEVETNLMKKILFVNFSMVLSTLTHLSVQHSCVKNQHVNKFFDGSGWESSLKTSIPLLKSFAFEFAFNYPHRALTIEDAKQILVPFWNRLLAERKTLACQFHLLFCIWITTFYTWISTW